MGFLQTITNLVNGNIRNNPNEIDKSEHSDVEQALANEICKTTTYDNNSIGAIIDELHAASQGVTYNINFKKIGKTVFLNGYVVGPRGISIFLKIKNPDYFCFGGHSELGNIYDTFFSRSTDTGNIGIVSIFKNQGDSYIAFFKPINDLNFAICDFAGNYESLN